MKPTHTQSDGTKTTSIRIKFWITLDDISSAIKYLIRADEKINKKTIIKQVRSTLLDQGECYSLNEEEWNPEDFPNIEEETEQIAKKYFPEWL